MKTNLFIQVSLALGLLFGCVSCSDEDVPILSQEEKDSLLEFTVKPISLNQMADIRRENAIFTSEADENGVITRVNNENIGEWVRPILHPFVGVGTELQNELILKIRINDFPEDVIVSDEDIQFILQADSLELAELGFLYSALSLAVEENEEGVDKTSVSIDKIISCFAVVTGIYAVSDLVSSTSALMTKQAAKKLFRTLLRRYATGYIGLAIAIYEFADCVGVSDE